jgi:hypothetical protein
MSNWSYPCATSVPDSTEASDNNICLLLDNNIGLRWDYVFCWTLPPVDIFYLIGLLGSSTFNFHLVNRMLITCDSSIGAFLYLTLLQCYL